ncbi:MAG: DUF1972 domain-containing protein [Bacteroidota bacterium]
MKSISIGIIGCRGIPNHYGGFEQFASFLSRGLAAKGHKVTVYNTHTHPYQQKKWEGVDIAHCYDPSASMGTMGQFLYDLNCIMDARRRKFDIVLVLGYTSSSVWGWLYPAQSVVITNMDGLEWKRSKYSAPVQSFLRYAEKLAVHFSKRQVADAIPVKEYLDDKYGIQSTYISYGAENCIETDKAVLEKYGVSKNNYHLLIARMEPENHIETILKGLTRQAGAEKILVVGSLANGYGKKMKALFGSNPAVQFLGTIYDAPELDNLREGCRLYFHGHSVGGTNPSLLEAMACGAMICAHDNVFNRSVLQEDAFYFSNEEDIETVASRIHPIEKVDNIRNRNRQKIREQYSWQKIIADYETLFIQSLEKGA